MSAGAEICAKPSLLFRNGQNSPSLLTRILFLCKDSRSVNVPIVITVLIYWILDSVWNVMAHAQKPDFVFRRNGQVHLNRQGRQFSRLLAAEVCASAVVMLDTPYCDVMWMALDTHSFRQFPLHFPSRASPCAIAFQLDSTSLSPVGINVYSDSWHGFILRFNF